MNKRLIAISSLTCLLAAAPLSGALATDRPLNVKEDMAQLQADKAALQRQIKRLEADEATFKADTASGRMSAMSKDAYEVYLAKQAVSGEKRDVASDQKATLQMKADREALQRQLKRLALAEKRLKSDAAEGKMSAMSKDSEKVYQDRKAVKAEHQEVTADNAKLKTEEKK
jgi:hypothetical protein